MRSPSPAERGAITAEWVITLPALVVVVAALTGGLSAGLGAQRLHQHSSDYARVLSLGGDPRGLVAPSATTTVEITREDDLVCVHSSDALASGWWSLAPLALRSHACALDSGLDESR